MFERFSAEARSTVVLSQVAARELGHNYIGSEHLLLALVRQDGDILEGTGVTADLLRTEILNIVGPGEGADPGHIPFTPRSKKVLALSLREALALKQRAISPDHLLLGLLREGQGLAVQILTKNGVELSALRGQVIARLTAAAPIGPARVPPQAMTPGAARAADVARQRAGGQPIGSQHYLLGLLADEDGVARRVLADLGVTPEAVEAKLRETETEGTSDELPEQAGARRTTVGVEGTSVYVRLDEEDLAARVQALIARTGPRLAGLESVWSATVPAVRNLVNRLESAAATTDWMPPGWGGGGVASFAVLSRPEGVTTRMWKTDDIDDATLRAWLADWLATRVPVTDGPDGYTYLIVSIDGRDGRPLAVTSFSTGARNAPPQWPLVPLADLVSAGIAELTAA